MLEIADLIGVPFVEFGRDCKKGLDCYGLVIEVEKRLGKQLLDVKAEKFDFNKVKKTIPQLNVYKTNTIKEGTILEFYSISDKRLHVAVALDSFRFIHATENQGVRISTLNSCKNYMILENIYGVI